MRKDIRYEIPFTGLKVGTHKFTFEVTGEFFVQFENSLIGECDVRVEVTLEKKTSFMLLDISIGGWVKTTCDRCLQFFRLEVLDEHKVVVRVVENPELADIDPEIMYLSKNDIVVDISQQLYELIHLSVPFQKNCKENSMDGIDCDPEVIIYLNQKDENQSDPRWEALKKLKS